MEHTLLQRQKKDEPSHFAASPQPPLRSVEIQEVAIILVNALAGSVVSAWPSPLSRESGTERTALSMDRLLALAFPFARAHETLQLAKPGMNSRTTTIAR